jgi:hypothetical protein
MPRCYKYKLMLVLSLLVFLYSCSAIKQVGPSATKNQPLGPEHILNAVDDAVAKDGVANGAVFRVPGFSYLRTTRLLVALEAQITTPQQKEIFVDHLRRLGTKSHNKEIISLSDVSLTRVTQQLGLPNNYQSLIAAVSEAADSLHARDAGGSGYYAAVAKALNVPDEYTFSYRVLGLYPLVAGPVAYLTVKARKKFQRWFDADYAKLETSGTLTAFGPAKEEALNHRKTVALLEASKDSLGLYMPDSASQKKLAQGLAPIIMQDVSGVYDRPGRIVWQAGHIFVDTTQPTVYYYFSHAIVDANPVLQINYVFWYKARSGNDSPAIERGPLDGITLRITLHPNGTPMMMDIMNSCGCYHLWVPNATHIKQPKPDSFKPGPFVPQWLPETSAPNRLAIRLNTGWHQIQRVFAMVRPKYTVTYQLKAYDELEMLPHTGERVESLFKPSGIAKGSWRMEPLLLFSMGVKDVGYMRQRGHHAIELVGRAHFDDPHLLEKKFVLNSP